MRHENKVRRAGLGRRVLAQLLSLTTAFTLLAPGGGGLLNARAATELQPQTLPATESTDNMEAKWMVSGDWGETGLTSNRYNMAGLNRNGSKQSITYGNYGVPLYLVMPTGTAHDPYIVHSYEASGGVGYNPNALVTAGSNKYYMAKMGQRKAELSAGNALPAGQNQALSPVTPQNGAVETTRFGPSGRYRTIETQVKTHVSGRYVLVDYYFYGRENLPPGGQKFYGLRPFGQCVVHVLSATAGKRTWIHHGSV